MRIIFLILMLFVSICVKSQEKNERYELMPSILSHAGLSINLSYIDEKEYLRLRDIYPHIKVVLNQKSDSLETIFKHNFSDFYTDMNCLKLAVNKQKERIFCKNLKPSDEKQFLDYKLIDLNQRFATFEVQYYEGTEYFLINLENRLIYQISGIPNFANSYKLIYSTYNSYGTEYISVLNLWNNTDVLIGFGDSGWTIMETYLVTESSLRLKVFNPQFPDNYRFIDIMIDNSVNY